LVDSFGTDEFIEPYIAYMPLGVL